MILMKNLYPNQYWPRILFLPVGSTVVLDILEGDALDTGLELSLDESLDLLSDSRSVFILKPKQ